MSSSENGNRQGANEAPEERKSNFIREIIDADLQAQRYQQVVTRFPPEPNGYLHIGHAKSICLNFGLATDYGGRCHLRFDDTNPTTEDIEYVESIQNDIKWLGFDWGEHLYFASDYFQTMYDLAERLIERELAYVDSLSQEEFADEYRGSLTEHGKNSPYRERSVEENLDLFRRMRAGEFEEGEHVLRAKIDMSSPNMLMRDPPLYRIRKAHHYRAGDDWNVWPMYDYAHCLEDAIEGITHSICTLEFENNRELYDWVIEHTGISEDLEHARRPYQHEFARLSLDYTVMSKRKLLQLVKEGHVCGWDDPRMPTIAAFRRRGVTPSAIRQFIDMIGVAKTNSVVDIGKLEFCIRDDLNHKAPRVMAVLDPLKVTITNYPEDQVEQLECSHWPHDVPHEGSRPVPFTRELFIERGDFMKDPPKGFYRLAPGREVRLRYAYFITCQEVIEDEEGNVIELRCSYDPETRGGNAPDGRKVRGTLHWVSATESIEARVHLYDRLFAVPRPDAAEDFLEQLNPDSLQILEHARLEPSLAGAQPGARFQFERNGYFVVDPDSGDDGLVFNRTISLRDSWGKKRQEQDRANTRAVATDDNVNKPPSPGKNKSKPSKRSRAQDREEARQADPVLAVRLTRYQEELDLSEEEADLLSGSRALGDFFEEALLAYDAPQSLANWITNELLRELKDDETTLENLETGPTQLATLARLVDEDAITQNVGKKVLLVLLEEGGDPEAIIDERGLRQLDDEGALKETIATILANNPDELGRYRDGERKLMGFFMGQVMRETRGKANPQLTQQLLQAALQEG